MAKKKFEPKVIKTIRKKNVSLATKRKAMKEARFIAKRKLADFRDREEIDSFACWTETPSGHSFWSNINKASEKLK